MATSAILPPSLGLSFLLSFGQRGVLSETSSEASQKKLVRQPSAVNCTHCQSRTPIRFGRSTRSISC